MPLFVADIFIVHDFVANNPVLICGFKQTKGKRHENSDSFDRIAAGIGCGVCVGDLWPLAAGGGGMTKDEALALDLALEALENGVDGQTSIEMDKAITAIKKALVRADERNRTWTQEHWTEYERSIAATEREACAKVCDELPAPDVYSDTDKSMWDVTCMDCAAAIRARSKDEK